MSNVATPATVSFEPEPETEAVAETSDETAKEPVA